MLKNKLKTIALLTILIFSLMIPIVRAENETTSESVMEATEESEDTSNRDESSSQTLYDNS